MYVCMYEAVSLYETIMQVYAYISNVWEGTYNSLRRE